MPAIKADSLEVPILDAISGIAGLTAVVLAGATALGLFGRRVPRFSQTLATLLVVYFIALADLLAVAQLSNLAAGNLVAGLVLGGLLIVTGTGPNRQPDDSGRDDWGR